jgi:antitoxin MazE
MEVKVRRIGNSQGIIIPAPLLLACNITDRAELEQRGDTLIIQRPQNPRQGWFTEYVEDEQSTREAQDWTELDVAEGDWEW